MTTLQRLGRRLIPTIHRPLNARFQRPQNYSLVLGLFGTVGAVCCAPGRQRTPVKTFVIQSDINNGGVITIGNSQVSLTNGIQLDPGRAWVFSVEGLTVSSGLMPTLTNWADEAAATRREEAPEELYLDLADFFLADDTGGQRARIYWSSIAR